MASFNLQKSVFSVFLRNMSTDKYIWQLSSDIKKDQKFKIKQINNLWDTPQPCCTCSDDIDLSQQQRTRVLLLFNKIFYKGNQLLNRVKKKM